MKFAQFIEKNWGVKVNPSSMFDIQVIISKQWLYVPLIVSNAVYSSFPVLCWVRMVKLLAQCVVRGTFGHPPF